MHKRGGKSNIIADWAKIDIITKCNAFKLKVPDGKFCVTDCLDSDGIIGLAKNFPNNRAVAFLDWFMDNDNTIAGQSKKKADALTRTTPSPHRS